MNKTIKTQFVLILLATFSVACDSNQVLREDLAKASIATESLPKPVRSLAQSGKSTAIAVDGATGEAVESIETPSKEPLPAYRVASNTSLSPRVGRRIEIHVNRSSLTKAQCIQLIDHYRALGAPDGQVSVRKPAKQLGGDLFPWCVENFDGEGIQFNDLPFQE